MSGVTCPSGPRDPRFTSEAEGSVSFRDKAGRLSAL
jgi:hypothetical protein